MKVSIVSPFLQLNSPLTNIKIILEFAYIGLSSGKSAQENPQAALSHERKWRLHLRFFDVF
jgi:hypothetical protein